MRYNIPDRFVQVASVAPSRVTPGGGDITASCICLRSNRTGLFLVLAPIQDSDCVYSNIVFPTQVTDDLPLAAATQRLVSRGSENFPPDFVARLARQVTGAYSGAAVHPDKTVYTLNAESSNGLIILLSPCFDALFFPDLSQASFEKVVYNGMGGGQMYQEVSRKNHETGMRTLERELYPKECPYHHTVSGTLDGVVKMDHEMVKNFHRTYYRPSNCFAILGGNVDVQSFLEVFASFDEVLETISAADERSLRYCPQTRIPLNAGKDERRSPSRVLQKASPLTVCDTMGDPSTVLIPLVRYTSVCNTGLEPLARYSMITKDALTAGPAAAATDHDTSTAASSLGTFCEGQSTYDFHFVFQGPDFAEHTEYVLFGLILELICDLFNNQIISEQGGGTGRHSHFSSSTTMSDTVRRGGLQPLFCTLLDRKWRIGVLTAKRLTPDNVDLTKKLIKKIVQEISPSEGKGRKILKQIDGVVNRYYEQIRWRAEFDLVSALNLWCTSIDEGDERRLKCLKSCVQPVNDYNEFHRLSDDDWKAFFDKYVRSSRLTFVLANCDEDDLDLERGFVSRQMDTLSNSSFTLEGGERLCEKDWETRDPDVELYIESLGGLKDYETFLPGDK